MLLHCTRGHRSRKVGRIHQRLEGFSLCFITQLLWLIAVGFHDALTRRCCPASRCSEVFNSGAECTFAILRWSHQSGKSSRDNSLAHRTARLLGYLLFPVGVEVSDRSARHRLLVRRCPGSQLVRSAWLNLTVDILRCRGCPAHRIRLLWCIRCDFHVIISPYPAIPNPHPQLTPTMLPTGCRRILVLPLRSGGTQKVQNLVLPRRLRL